MVTNLGRKLSLSYHEGPLVLPAVGKREEGERERGLRENEATRLRERKEEVEKQRGSNERERRARWKGSRERDQGRIAGEGRDT